MKKVFCITALALACSTAWAESQVTLYGNVDSFVAVQHNGKDAIVNLGSGGMRGSLWGIRGEEELGYGNSIIFKLENGFILNNGTNTPASGAGSPYGGSWAWQRESWLGVKGDWGTFTMGRQYSLNFTGIVQFDPFGMTLGSAIGNYFTPAPTKGLNAFNGQASYDNYTRRDNSFQYSTPSLGGLVLTAQIGLGEVTKSDGDWNNKTGNSYALQGVYRHDDLAIGVTWSLWSMAGQTYYQDHSTYNNQVEAVITYDFHVTKLLLSYMYKHGQHAGEIYRYGLAHDQPVLNNPTVQAWYVAANTPLWGGSWKLGFAYLHNNSYEKSDSWNIMTRYEYPISKRTTLYGGGGFLWNDTYTMYQISAGGGGSAAPDATMGKNYWTIFAGISHAF